MTEDQTFQEKRLQARRVQDIRIRTLARISRSPAGKTETTPLSEPSPINAANENREPTRHGEQRRRNSYLDSSRSTASDGPWKKRQSLAFKHSLFLINGSQLRFASGDPHAAELFIAYQDTHETIDIQKQEFNVNVQDKKLRRSLRIRSFNRSRYHVSQQRQ
jgi:hypothetical protein